MLWTDPHFSENEIESYRWKIFEHLLDNALKYNVTEIVCLGDLTDKRDRFSSILVNRMVDEFSYLQVNTKADVTVLSGNHDRPINGPYYWKFLDKLGIQYITQPELYKNVWLLPFSDNPKRDWKGLDLEASIAIFMHQTGQGATVEGGRELSSHNLPILPQNVISISGDVHRQQAINGIIYIGTPHPVRFSETWSNRMLIIKDNNFKNPIEIPLTYARRAILDIKNSSELEKLDYGSESQVRIRYLLSSSELTKWPEEEAKIVQWGKERGVHIASTEAVLLGEGVKASTQEGAQQLEMLKPDEIIREFATAEKLDEITTTMGLELLKMV